MTGIFRFLELEVWQISSMSYPEQKVFSVPYDFYALFVPLPGKFPPTFSLLTLLKDKLRHIKNVKRLFEQKLIRLGNIKSELVSSLP